MTLLITDQTFPASNLDLANAIYMYSMLYI
jgi:hypothetical protein